MSYILTISGASSEAHTSSLCLNPLCFFKVTGDVFSPFIKRRCILGITWMKPISVWSPILVENQAGLDTVHGSVTHNVLVAHVKSYDSD